MKKNLYYQTVFQRSNIIQSATRSLIFLIVCNARVLLEVFFRKSFGERYFSIPLVIFATAVLSLMPFAIGSSGYGGRSFDVITNNITWYLYVAFFIIYSFKRKQEIMREPSVFDFAKFSASQGRVNPYFRKLKIFGKTPTVRQIEIFIEPGICLGAGIILIMMGQKIGFVISIASILYSISYQMAYTEGDHFVMDMIDKAICTEELAQDMTLESEENSRGFYFRGAIPNSKSNRRKVLNNILGDEDFAESY